MSSFNPANTGGNNAGSGARIAEETAKKRESYITNKKGDAVGNNYTVEKGDFSKFLGYQPASQAELSGKQPVAGHRVLEVALQREFQTIGQGAADNGNSYRNMFVAQGKFSNQPGREKDAIKDGIDSIRQGPDRGSTAHDKNTGGLGESKGKLASGMEQYLKAMDKSQEKTHNDNVRYLEMQYKFQEISKQDSTISNLMKTRHDAVSRVIRGGQ